MKEVKTIKFTTNNQLQQPPKGNIKSQVQETKAPNNKLKLSYINQTPNILIIKRTQFYSNT